MKKITFRLLFRIILAAFTIFLLFNLIELRKSVNEKDAELKQLQYDINAQELENAALRDNMDEELTDEEIAEIAREKLGYSLPGERVFIDITGK